MHKQKNGKTNDFSSSTDSENDQNASLSHEITFSFFSKNQSNRYASKIGKRLKILKDNGKEGTEEIKCRVLKNASSFAAQLRAKNRAEALAKKRSERV